MQAALLFSGTFTKRLLVTAKDEACPVMSVFRANLPQLVSAGRHFAQKGDETVPKARPKPGKAGHLRISRADRRRWPGIRP